MTLLSTYYRITRPMPVVEVFGDVPAIPQEMRPARMGRKGDGPSIAGLAATHANQEDASTHSHPLGSGL